MRSEQFSENICSFLGMDEPTGTQVPSMFLNFVGSDIDWKYQTEPETQACLNEKDQRCYWPRGKVRIWTGIGLQMTSQNFLSHFHSINIISFSFSVWSSIYLSIFIRSTLNWPKCFISIVMMNKYSIKIK